LRAANYYAGVRGRRDPGPFARFVVAACQDAEAHEPRWATGAEPPPATVLDVGAGFGAVAVPVARHGRRVTVVEPHPSMLDLLRSWAAEERVSDRIQVVAGAWPDCAGEVEQHDVVVCAHVLYPVEDVLAFLEALLLAARRACLITLRLNDSDPEIKDLFRELHGEDQVPQPGFGDLVAVLAALGLRFEASTYESDSTSSYADLDEAELLLAEALLVADDPARRASVRAWAQSTLTEEDGRLVRPRRRVLAGVALLRPPNLPHPAGLLRARPSYLGAW
jgi:SAM-dependent methyltransferase